METMHQPHFAAQANQPFTFAQLRALGSAGLIALLTACASTPLPPWNPSPNPAPVPVPTQPGSSAPGKATATSATPTSAPAPAPAATTSNQALPYNAAVAARFPAPSVVYNTPGLQAGRNTFTSQAEIAAWLRTQASAAARAPNVKANILQMGQSQKGTALEALVLTHAASSDPAAVLASGKPTVLLVGQQHGNEPAGSEALLVIASELAQGLLQPVLDRINVIIVPRANPDGGASDQRATSGGLDMNRDHLLLNTPEAQALAKLMRDYQPTVVVDAHEYTVVGRYLQKFGTVQKFDALLQYATTANVNEFVTKAAVEWYHRPLLAALKEQNLSAEWYYTTTNDVADKKISMGGTRPDTGRNVNSLKNAVSLLIETRGVGIDRLHIQRRVHTQVTAIMSVLASTAQKSAELMQLRPYVDKTISSQACKDDAIVEAAPTAAQYDLTMLDPSTGADKVLSVDWDSALLLRTLKTRPRPCGYWLAASANTAIERLRMHGVQIMRVGVNASVLGDTYTEVSRTEGKRQDVLGAIEAASPIIKVQVNLARALVDMPPGSYYVPLNQPLANLVIAALEPDTQSSFFANQLIDSLQSTVRVMQEPNVKLDKVP